MAHIPLPGATNQTANRTRARRQADRVITMSPTPDASRYASCFRENYRTNGPVLTSNTYSTDAACIKLCLATSGLVIHNYEQL